MTFDISSFVDQDTQQVFADDVNGRIGALQGERSEYEDEGRSFPECLAAELRELLQFRAEVQQALGVAQMDDLVVIVPEDNFVGYVTHLAQQNDIEAELSPYMDWERYAGDQMKMACWAALELGGETVYVSIL